MKGEYDCHFLIATPEKALCDYICFNKVTLRFMKDVRLFLVEDIRFDTDAIQDLDLRIIEQCSEQGRISVSDISAIKQDVLPYIVDKRELEIWSRDYFLQLADMIRFENDEVDSGI